MSQASDLLAELKQLVADATKEVKAFEGDLGVFTDVAHLNIARLHLREFGVVIDAATSNALVDPEAEAEAYAEFLAARAPDGFVPQGVPQSPEELGLATAALEPTPAPSAPASTSEPAADGALSNLIEQSP